MKHAIRAMRNVGMGISSQIGLPAEGTPSSLTLFLCAWNARNKASITQTMGSYTMVLILYQAMRWIGYHMPVFRPSVSLFSMLTLTDVSSILMRDVHLPFDTFLVEIPLEWYSDFRVGRDRLQIAVLHSFQRQNKTEGCFVLNPAEVINEIPSWSIYLMSERGGEIHHWDFYNDNRTIGEWTATNTRPHEDTLPYWSSALDDRDLSIIAACTNAVVGLAIYIAEHDAGRKLSSHTTRRKSARFARKNPDPEVYVIGDAIKVDENIVQAATALVSDRATWTIKRRHVVRGHWRDQPCGPGRAERRRKWIAPFWKGPKEGEKLSHVYEAEGTK